MLDKLKQLKELKGLQNQLEQEKVEVEKNGVKIIMSGKMEIQEINLNVELTKEEQEETIKDCLNEAMKKIQTLAAQKMFKM